jgi:hypothetical protein
MFKQPVMRNPWSGLVLALMLVMASSMDAQQPATETNQPPIIPFLAGTDVFWTVQGGKGVTTVFPNKLEADIFPHLVVAQNFSRTLDLAAQGQRGLAGLKEFSYAVSATPAVRIRMLRDVSAPVRTPSYMPMVNAQFLWTRGLRDCAAPSSNGCLPVSLPQGIRAAMSTDALQVASALYALPRVSVWEGHVTVGHHSNGQDGCLTNGQRRDPPETGECEPAAVPTAETINRRDGSFATSYIRAGMNYSRNWMDGDLQAIREMRARAELEYHPRPWVDDDIVGIYGRARLIVGAAYAAKDVRLCQRRLEGSASATWNPGVVDTVRQLSSTAQLSCFPWENGGWGIFVRVYRGQDYYNVGFLDNITRVHIGATFNQTGFFRFRRPSP